MQDRASAALKQAHHDVGGAVVGRADDNAVRIQKIGDGTSLAQKFGRYRQPEFAQTQRGGALDFLAHRPVGAAGDHGALDRDDNVVISAGKTNAHIGGDRPDIGQIDAGVARWGADRNHDDVDVSKRGVKVVGYFKTVGELNLRKQLGNARLMEKYLATAQCRKPCMVLFNANAVPAESGKPQSGNQPHIAGANDCDLHG